MPGSRPSPHARRAPNADNGTPHEPARRPRSDHRHPHRHTDLRPRPRRTHCAGCCPRCHRSQHRPRATRSGGSAADPLPDPTPGRRRGGPHPCHGWLPNLGYRPAAAPRSGECCCPPDPGCPRRDLRAPGQAPRAASSSPGSQAPAQRGNPGLAGTRPTPQVGSAAPPPRSLPPDRAACATLRRWPALRH